MFIQSLADSSLSPHVTSIHGQIQLFTESIDAFKETDVALSSNLSIDDITNTLTAFPTPLESSISFATANCYIYNDSSSNENIVLQGFISSVTSNPRSHDTGGKTRLASHEAPRKRTRWILPRTLFVEGVIVEDIWR